MTKFKEGDKVRFTDETNTAWFGVEAVVTSIEPSGNLKVELTKGATGWASSYVAGSEATLSPYILELIEEPAFKEGDRVTVKGWETSKNPYWEGKTGEVYLLDGEIACITFDDGTRGGFLFKYLVPAEEPKPFTFEDIQVGDTIRRTRVYLSGATEVREGTVDKDGRGYKAQSNFILAYDTDTNSKGVTLELLNRPEPEPEPTLLQDTKAGDQLTITLKSGVKKVYTKLEDGDWKTLVLTDNGKAYTGFTWTSEELEQEVKHVHITNHTLIPA